MDLEALGAKPIGKSGPVRRLSRNQSIGLCFLRFATIQTYTDVYSSNFTPQVSVLTSTSNVNLLVLQPLRWCCVDCVIHHERDVREEQKYMCSI